MFYSYQKSKVNSLKKKVEIKNKNIDSQIPRLEWFGELPDAT